MSPKHYNRSVKNLKAQTTILAIVFIVIVSAALVGYLYFQNRELKSSAPRSTTLTWEECLKLPKAIIQESYPGVCRLPDGRSAVQPLSEEEKKKLQPPDPTRESTGSPEKTEGSFCGGFAGKLCPDGYECQMEGNYPDASGTCIKK